MLIEIDGGWKMTEYRPEAVGEPAGKAGAVIGCLEASIQLIEPSKKSLKFSQYDPVPHIP